MKEISFNFNTLSSKNKIYYWMGRERFYFGDFSLLRSRMKLLEGLPKAAIGQMGITIRRRNARMT